MVDYLVVGLGLAGISFCETLEGAGKGFKLISDRSQQASRVAGGLYNPVILKRFTLAWKAGEQLELALSFYQGLERKLGLVLDHKIPVLRRLASVEEQNAWFEALDRPGLDRFLSPHILPNTNPQVDAPFGYGEVYHTGKIDTGLLVEAYGSYLEGRGLLRWESFDFKALKFFEGYVEYQGERYGQLVLACGYGLKGDPQFGYLPLNGTKGELLTIKAPDYGEERIIKGSVFTIPLGEDLYQVGSTYKWRDKDNEPTEEAREELLGKLGGFLKCSFHVVDHRAGIRPTVVDRKPLVGRHPLHKNLYVLNGMGSRGVLIAPYAARQLFRLIDQGIPLDRDLDIGRFTTKYYSGATAD